MSEAYVGRIETCCGQKWFVTVGGRCPKCGRELYSKAELQQVPPETLRERLLNRGTVVR